MERAYFTEHRGKRIFLMDCSNASKDEMDTVIAECIRQVRCLPEKSALTLTIAGGSSFSSETITKLKELARDNAPYVKTAAIVGVTGLYKVVFNAVSIFSKRKFNLFDKVEDAMDFLAES